MSSPPSELDQKIPLATSLHSTDQVSVRKELSKPPWMVEQVIPGRLVSHPYNLAQILIRHHGQQGFYVVASKPTSRHGLVSFRSAG